jgi:outer membrane protein TolC
LIGGYPVLSLAQAPVPLTLTAAIARAQTASFDVRLAQADLEASLARVAGSRANLLPQIGVSGTTMNGGIAQLGMPIAQQTYLSLSASVPLFVPADSQTARASAFAAQGAAFDASRSQNDAAYAATLGYERVLLSEAIVSSRRLTVDYQQRRSAQVALRFRSGAAPRYEALQAGAALAQARRSLEDGAADRDEALADLEVILDLPIDPSLQLADTLVPLPTTEQVDGIRQRALAQRPEILDAQAQVDAAAARLAAARNRYLPAVGANAQTYTGRSNPDLGAHGYQVGVTASLPLLDGGARGADVTEMEAAVKRARILVEQARRSVERDVANAWREYVASQGNLDLARTQATAAAEELRIAALRERAGKGIALETLAALSDDAGAREDVLRAVARLNDAVAALRHSETDTIN